MDNKVLSEHKLLIFMIYELFEGSIRYEYLLDIILKTKYNNINSQSACSRFFTTLKKAEILKEMTDFDYNKRFYLNKPVLAYFKGVPSTKTSSVSRKASTLIKSNFKVRYFIENYVDKYDSLDLRHLYELASKSCGNLLNSNDKYMLNRICKVFDTNLTDNALHSILTEDEDKRKNHKKQLQSLKKGPVARVEQAKLKNENIDVYEEYYGDPITKEVSLKKNKTSKKKVVSLQNLKSNNVYLSDVIMEDIQINMPYVSSVKLKDSSSLRYATRFENLQTKQVTLKFVYFCSAREVKTSKIKSIYESVQDYASKFEVKDVVTPTVFKILKHNVDQLDKIDSKTLSKSLSNIAFSEPQIVKIIVDLDIIFINEINYKRVIKKLLKDKLLTDYLNPIDYKVSQDYRISFRHYDFYNMNEHDPE